MISTLAQLIVDGLAMGMVYVLLASGINLIIAISGILLIAYGEFYMLGAYILWSLMVLLNIPFFAALFITTLVLFILGGIIYRLIFHRIQIMNRQFLNGIVAAIGLTLVMAQGAILAFGTSARGVQTVFPGILKLAGISISFQKVVLILLGILVLLILHFVLQKTNVGRAMRAVSFNPDVATLQGVNSRRIYLITMALACGLAGFAGGVMAPAFAISPEMGSVTLLILLVVMLGGIGSMVGVILAGIILGTTLSFGQYYIGTGVSQILFFAVVGLIIFFRPGGLLGQNTDITV
jgi:branched-chain amino acid transport system permease protein